MNITPIANWRAVLKHAWSVRLMLGAALLSGIEVLLPLLAGFVDIPAGIFALLSFGFTVAAFVARFAVQKQLTPPAADPTEIDWTHGDEE